MKTLKGIIGTVTGTQTLWIAQSPVYRHSPVDKMLAHRIRALHLKQNELNKFKGVCVLETGQKIYAPKVASVKVQNTEFGHCSLVTWKFDDIDLRQFVKIYRIKLIDDLGFFVMDWIPHFPVTGVSGDMIQLQEITIKAN